MSAARCLWSVRCRNNPGNFAYCADHRCFNTGCLTALQQDVFTTYHSDHYAPFGQYCEYHTCPVQQGDEPRLERPHKDRVDQATLDLDHEFDWLRHCEVPQCRYGIKSGGHECNTPIEPTLIGTPFCSTHKNRGLRGMSEYNMCRLLYS
ncbi:hypothetical protein SCUP515_12938 [Seiridium cupressi]